MSYFLRFTNNEAETNSFNGFTGEDFGGLCCFELDCEYDELMYSIRMQTESNADYAKYYDGNYIVFEGVKIADNPYGNGVIAEMGNIIRRGQVRWNKEAYTYQIIKDEKV